jgi:hypothetical protein
VSRDAVSEICRVPGVEFPIFEASQDVDVVHVLMSDEVGVSCRLRGPGPVKPALRARHGWSCRLTWVPTAWGPVKSALRAYHGPPVKAAPPGPPTVLRPRAKPRDKKGGQPEAVLPFCFTG